MNFVADTRFGVTSTCKTRSASSIGLVRVTRRTPHRSPSRGRSQVRVISNMVAIGFFIIGVLLMLSEYVIYISNSTATTLVAIIPLVLALAITSAIHNAARNTKE